MSEKQIRKEIISLISSAGSRELDLIWRLTRILIEPNKQEAKHGQAD